MMQESPKNKAAHHSKTPRAGGPRSAARLAGVQALYQLGMSDKPVSERVVQEYIKHRLGQEIEGDVYAPADQSLFTDIVKGGFDRRAEWDGLLEPHLSADWSLGRLDPVLHAILRAGTYELSARPDVPHAVVINEYVDIAHAFFERADASFVNGILDKIAKQVREGLLKPAETPNHAPKS